MTGRAQGGGNYGLILKTPVEIFCVAMVQILYKLAKNHSVDYTAIPPSYTIITIPLKNYGPASINYAVTRFRITRKEPDR